MAWQRWPQRRYGGYRGGYRRRGYGGYGNGGYYKRKYFQQQRLKAKVRNQLIGGAGGRGTPANIERWGADWATANADQRMGRQIFGYYGKGDYKDVLRWGSRGLGAVAGAGIGFSAGGGKGALRGGQLGYNAGSQFSKWAGWGDYNPQGPNGVAVNDIMMEDSQKKITVNPGDSSGDIIFQHTEFIQNVVVQPDASERSPFTVQSFGLNPGIETTFPFLAQLAGNFSLYELQGLIFQYKPTTGEGGTNALGKVIMATNYDPSALPFTNSQAMENYDYAHSVKPSNGMHHGVETASGQRLTNQLYVRTNVDSPGPAGPGEKDKVLTDLGLFQVATEGIVVPTSGTTLVGELWVTYKVKLSRASLQNTQELTLANGIRGQWQQPGSAFVTPLPGHLVTPNSSLDVRLTAASTTSVNFTFPQNVVAGTYLVVINHSNLGSTPNQVVCTNGLLCPWGTSGVTAKVASTTLTTLLDDYLRCSLQNPLNAAGPVCAMFMVDVLAPDNAQASFELGWSGLPTGGGGYVNYAVTQINSALIPIPSVTAS